MSLERPIVLVRDNETLVRCGECDRTWAVKVFEVQIENPRVMGFNENCPFCGLPHSGMWKVDNGLELVE